MVRKKRLRVNFIKILLPFHSLETEAVKQSGTAVPDLSFQNYELVGLPKTECQTSRLFPVSFFTPYKSMFIFFPARERHGDVQSVLDSPQPRTKEQRTQGSFLQDLGCSLLSRAETFNHMTKYKNRNRTIVSNGSVHIFVKNVTHSQWRCSAKDICPTTSKLKIVFSAILEIVKTVENYSCHSIVVDFQDIAVVFCTINKKCQYCTI